MAILQRGWRGGLLVNAYRKLLHKLFVNDLWLDVRLAAKREAVEYVLAHMTDAAVRRDRYDLLGFALAEAPAEGLVLEFGVAKGASLRHLAGLTSRIVHGFDSFQGLPSGWAGTAEGAGAFSTKGRLPKVPANARLHVGWFDATLPAFLAGNPGPVALLHVDCDIYASNRTIFVLLRDRIVPGNRDRVRRIFQLSWLARPRVQGVPGVRGRNRPVVSLSRLFRRARACRGADRLAGGDVIDQTHRPELCRRDQARARGGPIDRAQGRAIDQRDIIHSEPRRLQPCPRARQHRCRAGPIRQRRGRVAQSTGSTGARVRSLSKRYRLRDDSARPSASRTVGTPITRTGRCRSAAMRVTTCNCCQSFSPKKPNSAPTWPNSLATTVATPRKCPGRDAPSQPSAGPAATIVVAPSPGTSFRPRAARPERHPRRRGSPGHRPRRADSGSVLGRSELHRVDEDRGHRRRLAGRGRDHQRAMALVQRAHRRHEAKPPAVARIAAQALRSSEGCGRSAWATSLALALAQGKPGRNWGATRFGCGLAGARIPSYEPALSEPESVFQYGSS